MTRTGRGVVGILSSFNERISNLMGIMADLGLFTRINGFCVPHPTLFDWVGEEGANA